MTRVLCWRDECKYLSDGSVCSCGCISIDENGECENFEDYRNDAEWRNVFWKRMFDKERKQECRVQALGKKLEIGGRAFFIESRSYHTTLTDEETGMACGSLAHLNENVDIIGKIAAKAMGFIPVLNLPIAVYDEKSRSFSYPGEEREGAE